MLPLPPSEGEGATPENGMRHIDNKKTPVDFEQAPDDYHYKISHAPLAANAAREEGLHERSSYLISPDDLPPSEGEGALPENGIRHIHNLKR